MALINPKQLQSGSYSISGSFSGSFRGDGSGLTNLPSQSVNTSSFVTTSSFNSFTSSINSFTASYNTGSFTGSFTGSLNGTASYALTASYAMNGGGGGNINTSSLVTTASFNAFTSSYTTGSFTGSFRGDFSEFIKETSNTIDISILGQQDTNGTTSSINLDPSEISNGNQLVIISDDSQLYSRIGWGFDAIAMSIKSESFQNTFQIYPTYSIFNKPVISPSFTGSLQGIASTASYITASSVVGTVTSASYALTASYISGSININTDSLVTTASFNAFTSSINSFTASYNTGSFTGSFTGSLNGTSSWANNALTASYVVTAQTASYVQNAQTASYVLQVVSASYAQTASYVQTAQTASYVLQAISSSFASTASYILNAQTASYVQNAQTASYVLQAVSSSFASTASYVTLAQTASYVLNAVSSSFASTASYATIAGNGGVTQLLAGPNIILGPTNGLGQVTVSATLSGSTVFNTATGSYGSFYSTSSQTNPVGNIPRSMSLDHTDITNGVSISGSTNPFNTYIKTENAGVYNIQFSAQVEKTDSGTDEIVIWLRKNGIDLTDTATTITLVGNSTKIVAAWNWFVTSAANDYYQIIWISADTGMILLAETISGTHPGIPSVIVTANRVDQFLSNTGSFSGSFTGNFTGSLLGTAATASYVLQSVSSSFASTASYVTASNVVGTVTSASYALTASYVTDGGNINTSSLVTTASFNAFTSSYTTGSFTGSFYGDGSNLSLAASTTGVVISFSASYIYNSPTSAGTGSITDNLAGSKLGIVQKIYHNDTSLTVPSLTWVKLGSGTYTPSSLNIIYAEWVSGSRVEYWIVKGS